MSTKTEVSDAVQTDVGRMITDAVDYIETELSPLRAKATRYYNAQLFGNEEEGRSQVVNSVVRDAVDGLLPGMLEVFWGPDRVVEFEAPSEAKAALAEQQTDYVNHIVTQENDGFLTMHGVLKDAFVRRLGVYKWGWQEDYPCAHELEGLTETQVAQLKEDPDVTITSATPTGKTAPPMEAGAPPEALYDVACVVKGEGRERVWCVPPECFVWNRGARSIEEARIVAHIDDEKTTTELLALGISQADIDAHGGARGAETPEKLEREAALGHLGDDDDATADVHTYVEAYVRYDYDGDGRDELRLYQALGPEFTIVGTPKPVSERPFAVYCPLPESSEVDGFSVADKTMPMQLVTSSLLRGTLDSLSLSLFPRTTYVEGQASVADILNNAIGAPIRMKAPGMVADLKHPFAGADVLPVLTYFDELTERRTGQSKGAQGLDADALQSSTKTAVAAAITATQMQSRLYARLFAEQTLKPLFRGLLRLIAAHQPRARTLKLRGKWVDVDPTQFDPSMGVITHVALGSGATEEKIAAVAAVSEKQEQIFATLGPQNPLVTLGQYRYTLGRMLELRGIKDTHNYLNDVPPDYQPPPAAAPQPSPEQVLAQAQMQIEQMKAQKDIEIKQAELQLKREAQQQDYQLELLKIANALEMKRLEVNAQFGAATTAAQAAAETEGTQQILDARAAVAQHTLDAQGQAHDQALARQQQAHDQALAQQQQGHAQEMAERSADAEDTAAEQSGGEA